MAIIETQTIESINDQDINQLSSKTLIRSFGQSNDSIELTIFDQNSKDRMLVKTINQLGLSKVFFSQEQSNKIVEIETINAMDLNTDIISYHACKSHFKQVVIPFILY